MKKTLSVILAVLLLVCCLPFSVFAEETIISAEDYANEHDNVLDGSNAVYTVPADEIFTIEGGEYLYIESGATLEVYGTLNAIGHVISRGGSLVLKLDPENGTYGTVTQPDDGQGHVGGNDPEKYRAEVMFSDKDLFNFTVSDHHIANARYFSATNGSSYADLDNTDSFTGFAFNNSVVQVNLGQYLFFKMDLLDENGSSKKYDADKLVFAFNGVKIKNAQSVNRVQVTTAGVISFAGDKAWNEDTYIRRMRIYIPTGAGYSVYGVSGETSADTETVRLKYGSDFTFRVDVDADYDRSEYEIYLVNTYQFVASRYAVSLAEMAQAYNDWTDDSFYETEGKYPCVKEFRPGDGSDGNIYIDENGYCHIPGSFIDRDCSIAVSGVVKNETLTFIAKIVEMLKNVFNAISSFFEMIANAFK